MSLDAPAGEASAPADSPVSAREAGRLLAEARWKRDTEPTEQPERVAEQPETPEPNLSPEGDDAAPPQEALSEPTEAQPDPAEQPPIEPPRSWTKEAKERWQSLPRETQEYLAQREQERDRELRRSQNEHADKLKSLTAREQAAEQARVQYEQALPALLHTLQQQQAGEFADIKTMADVEKLAREDWPRYALWDAQQKKLAAVTQELQAAQQRQVSDYRQKWSDFSAREDRAFADKVPEVADTAKYKALQEAAIGVLHDSGFTEQELARLWNGEASVSLRDHRVQLLIRDAVKLRQAQKAAKPAAKPLPPVLRPGSGADRVDAGTLEMKSLEKRANETRNPRDFAKLLAARRASQNRQAGY